MIHEGPFNGLLLNAWHKFFDKINGLSSHKPYYTKDFLKYGQGVKLIRCFPVSAILFYDNYLHCYALNEL